MTERNHVLPPDLSPPDPIQEVEALKFVVKELTAKIQFLVDWADGHQMLQDGSFTFPDGDVWKARDEDLTNS